MVEVINHKAHTYSLLVCVNANLVLNSQIPLTFELARPILLFISKQYSSVQVAPGHTVLSTSSVPAALRKVSYTLDNEKKLDENRQCW